jgi:hypothetical protein
LVVELEMGWSWHAATHAEEGEGKHEGLVVALGLNWECLDRFGWHLLHSDRIHWNFSNEGWVSNHGLILIWLGTRRVRVVGLVHHLLGVLGVLRRILHRVLLGILLCVLGRVLLSELRIDFLLVYCRLLSRQNGICKLLALNWHILRWRFSS